MRVLHARSRGVTGDLPVGFDRWGRQSLPEGLPQVSLLDAFHTMAKDQRIPP
jgi:hypothetical protein